MPFYFPAGQISAPLRFDREHGFNQFGIQAKTAQELLRITEMI